MGDIEEKNAEIIILAIIWLAPAQLTLVLYFANQ